MLLYIWPLHNHTHQGTASNPDYPANLLLDFIQYLDMAMTI